MAQVANDFEAGTLTNALSTADPGSPTAFSVIVAPPAGGSLIYDNTHVAFGSKAAKVSVAGTAGAPAFGLNHGVLTDHYGRLYLWLTANPGIAFNLIRNRRASDTATTAQVAISTTGKITCTDSVAANTTGAVSIATGQWVRLEWRFKHSATVGLIEAKLFNTAASTVPDEIITTPATRNTLADGDTTRFGQNGPGSVTNVSLWIDQLVAGAAAYPGPNAAFTYEDFAADLSGAGAMAFTAQFGFHAQAGIAGAGGLTEALETDKYLTADISGQGALTTAMNAEKQLGVALAGLGSLAAGAQFTQPLIVGIAGAGGLSETLQAGRNLATTITVAGSMSETMQAGAQLSAPLAGTGSLAAGMSAYVDLVTIMAATGQLTATLRQGAIFAQIVTGLLRRGDNHVTRPKPVAAVRTGPASRGARIRA